MPRAYRIPKCLCLVTLLAVAAAGFGTAGFGTAARADTVADLRQALDRGG